MVRRVIAAIAVSLSIAATAPSALAQQGDCYFRDGKLLCFGDAPGTPTTAPPAADPGGPGEAGPNPSRFQWQAGFYGGFCTRDGGVGADSPLQPDQVVGQLVTPILIDTVTGIIVQWGTPTCVLPGETAPAPPPPPPPPPSTGEVAAAMRHLLVVDTQLSPRVQIGGLTGLNTRIWCTDPGEIVTSLTIRGYQVEGHAVVSALQWTIDGTRRGGSWDADTCGTADDAAATWMPETKGPYTVDLTTTWGGYWTFSLNGARLGTYDLGDIDIASPTIAYPVDEYRGVLTG